MLKKHFDEYLSKSFKLEISEQAPGGEIKTGVLTKGDQKFPIHEFIPRFCPESNYADSFSLQWHQFRATQLDSKNQTKLSHERFYTFTGWKKEELKGKKILEVGCGPGRFTEVMLEAGAKVVSLDYSNATDVCYANNKSDDLFLFQGDLFEIPLQKASFDYVFCFGVLQHTPDPLKAFQAIVQFAKPGGRISVDNYINRLLSPYCTPKYIWRTFSTKIPHKTLLTIIRFYVPLYLPFDTFVRKIPKIGPRILALIPIPCWNYLDWGLSKKERKEWAILDTYDALATTYDYPLEIKDFELACEELRLKEFKVFYGSNGLVANATR